MSLLLSREEMISQGYPWGKAAEGIPLGNPATEWMRTEPDALLYVPPGDLGDDCDNCVLAVLPTFDEKELIAIWTQSSVEAGGDNRIVIARSRDGIHWTPPQYIIGACRKEKKQSSWGMPMYNASGRLYIFFIQETDHPDDHMTRVTSGDLALMYSDDDGITWSRPGIVRLPRCKWDNPDAGKTKNWWSQQAPVRDAQGRYIAGFTMNTSPSVKKTETANTIYRNYDTHAAFIRFENLDDNPEPEDVRVTITPENGLSIPRRANLAMSAAEEASPVLLPDGRLFATMRNLSGFMQYTVLENGVWRDPSPVLLEDGRPLPHPLSPCTMFALRDERYLCLTNNNPGVRDGKDVQAATSAEWYKSYYVRNPLYLTVGVFDPAGHQPIRFGQPRQFLNSGDIAIGQRKKSSAAPVYCALTQWQGKTMLWYPDRKYYILGKEITDALLEELMPDGRE